MMNRRRFLRNSALAGVSLSNLTLVSGNTFLKKWEKPKEVELNEFNELTVNELQEKVKSGKLTYLGLTEFYLYRIEQLDKLGPQINAVIQVNPDALILATQMDDEFSKGHWRGPLHGIPVLIKDNIDTGDKMLTTAGSLALSDNFAKTDATLVQLLRNAGAVILGKTNLSEWANYRSTRAASGWSSRGGQTKNPYLLDRSPCGSSSGSGVAVSANLCSIAIGTETDGSIACPASMNGVVGLKPTVGLVSRSGIIPISKSQDTAGPLTRCVADAALLLTVIAAPDPKDEATLKSHSFPVDYTAYLHKNGLKNKRIGVEKSMLRQHEAIDEKLKKALDQMQLEGATIIEVEFAKLTEEFSKTETEILNYEFKDGINKYLSTATTKMKSLEDLINFNIHYEFLVMPYFKQEIFITALKKGGLDSKEYLEAQIKMEGLRKLISELFEMEKLDALCGPATGTAWCTDVINGDFWTGYGAYSCAAMTGNPSITVPMGFVNDLPVGLSFIGKPFDEAGIITIGYAYEQASKNRKEPEFKTTMKI